MERLQKQAEEQRKEGVREVVVEQVAFVDVTAYVKLTPLPGRADLLEIKLDPITLEHLTGVGDRTELTILLMRKLLLSIVKVVVKQISTLLPDQMQKAISTSADLIKKSLEGFAPQGIKEKGDKLLEIPSGLAESLRKAAGDADPNRSG